MAGGSYLVARRIRMHIETWDRETLDGQQKIIGRTKGAGAPLGQTAEFDELDLDVGGAGGEKVIPEDAHVRLASHQALNGVRILRRGYNFVDGSDGVGHLDAGLFFLAFKRDTRKQYVPMQQALSVEGRDDGVRPAHRVRRTSRCRRAFPRPATGARASSPSPPVPSGTGRGSGC